MLSAWHLDNREVAAFTADMAILCFASLAGFPLTRGYLANPYWKNDYFTKQLASLRVLPIPVGTLAFSRSLQLLILSPLTMAVFFGVMYISSEWVRQLPLLTYISTILVWFGFGNFVGAWHVVKEWGGSGKRYFWSSFAVVLIIILACAAVWAASGNHLFTGLAELLIRPAAGWTGAAAGVAVTVLSHIWMNWKLRGLLTSRDFA